MSTTIFTSIPFAPTFDEFGRHIKISAYKGLEEEIQSFFNRAVSLLQPKAAFRVCAVEQRLEDGVVIDSAQFISRVLRKQLEEVERVFVYLVTCGNELENVAFNPGDFLEPFLKDELKQMALTQARAFLKEYIQETYRIPNTAYMSPGSGDVGVWPIQQQKALFSLLDPTPEEIGVVLTESFLMHPNKTVSGIIFPTEVGFETCQVCSRKTCPNRRAAYVGEHAL